jgi:hypothetical protein
MNFDHNGTLVRKTQPTRSLKKVTKVLTIDSRDRDTTKFVKVVGGATASDPGDYVVYLPRVYENVVSLRIKNAIISAPQTDGFVSTDLYILMGIEGLNRIDETAAGADRSGYVDSALAKFPVYTNTALAKTTSTLFYNDSSFDEQVTRFTPPIGRLDRFHITLRRHVGALGTTTPLNAPITFGTSENSFTFEIEYLDNVFDDFSSFETRLNV